MIKPAISRSAFIYQAELIVTNSLKKTASSTKYNLSQKPEDEIDRTKIT